MQLKNENGAVEIEVSKLGNIQVENSRGDIRISVPEKSSFQVEAQARDGEIQSDFSELRIENGDNRASASGSVNGGTSRIVLNNEHGTIEIRKGTTVPVPPMPATPKMPKLPKVPEVPQPTEN